MYNRDNFRDIYSEKPRDIPRSEYIAANQIYENDNYYKYQSQKAKKFLRYYNDSKRNGITEFSETRHNEDIATHMHHIFPESRYPSISYYYENLIALTPTQHLNNAHPLGNTHEINQQYQHLLLLAKTDIIRENLSQEESEQIYSFNKLITVLDVGFKNEEGYFIQDLDFCMIVNIINSYYFNLLIE